MKKQIIFNSSMPRSGSELMQVILHQNPDIYGSVTSPVLGFCEGVKNHMEIPEVTSQPSSLMRDASLGSCRGLMDGYYNAMTERPTVCDKSRGWMVIYEWLQDILGEKPKMICCIRDLREVMVSQELTWRKNQHLAIGGGITVGHRVEEWLTQSHIAHSLQRLTDAEARGFIGDIHFVRYEDLTEQPEATMKGVYEYLELSHFDHDFKNVVKEVEENHEVHGPYGNHDVKPVVAPTLPRYNEVLGRQVSENIVASNSWFYNKFYK